jgi:DNA-binding CsgD family transcriptional regulator/tetratricopeptide (TPR) repeat protein
MVANRALDLVGRASERDALDRLLDNVRAGQSAVLVIRGEPGIGKTSLLQYAARQAPGFRVAQIAGVEAEMELPFAGVHQLCRPILDRLDALPEPQRVAMSVAFGLSLGEPPDRFLVALAALSLLSDVAEERPLLCLVDDAQWLDSASAQVLGFVARRLLAESVAIVFAVREPSGEPELVGLPELQLGGLAEDESRALLAGVIPGRLDEPVRDRIVAETRGNPLALLELPRGLTAAELAGGFALPDAMGLPGRIQDLYQRRVIALPEPTRRLMLLAAADPVGDATLLWRAAQSLGIGRTAAEVAAGEKLLEIGGRVRFRHPLVRSAVYSASPAAERQVAHGALAAATDAAVDPDRRAWHRAHATNAPDETVAGELIDCAGGAERRGGIAAAAAFLERAVTFTPDPARRASRALTAARAKFQTGDFAAAEALLAGAEAGPLDELGLAQAQRMRAQIAFDMRRGRDAPRLLLRAAQRLEPLDAGLARDTHLEALVAAIYASCYAAGTDVNDVAVAARRTPLDPEPIPASQLLLLGLATRLTDGCAAAAPTLSKALLAYRGEERRLDRLCLAYNIAAEELWDEEAWRELADSQVELARATGTLLLLPYALDYLAGALTQAGELSAAALLLTEAEGLGMGVRAEFPLRLAAWRGQEEVALSLVEAMTHGAEARGEGCAIAGAEYDLAVLYNGLAQYERALDAAQQACASDDIVVSSWGLFELTEAASRCGRTDVARDAALRLAERTTSGTRWAMGALARSRALVEDGDRADDLYRQAIGWLGPSRMTWYLARTRLSYGEWLRRQGRRIDAREQLRAAHRAFTAMGAEGFAERARVELLATGGTVRKRRAETRDELTTQERQIAQLAHDGLSNPEIGSRLFLSPRTVEWHLRKVFTKLGIRSRRELAGALPSSASEMAPA